MTPLSSATFPLLHISVNIHYQTTSCIKVQCFSIKNSVTNKNRPCKSWPVVVRFAADAPQSVRIILRGKVWVLTVIWWHIFRLWQLRVVFIMICEGTCHVCTWKWLVKKIRHFIRIQHLLDIMSAGLLAYWQQITWHRSIVQYTV